MVTELPATIFGINLWLFIVLAIWSGIWKLLALWKAARKNSVAWFIVLGIVNTVGILEILYIFWLSKLGKKSTKKFSRRR
jgi:methionyl-tRNA synthetase